MVFDKCQLRGEPPLGFVAVLRAGWVAFLELRVAELCQGTGSGQTVGAVEVGEAVAQIAGEIERPAALGDRERIGDSIGDRKSTRLNSSHGYISYAVFCLKKKKKEDKDKN